MKEPGRNPVQYVIMDPTGNITLLVESFVEVSRQPAAAGELMRRHPEAEQVGFVQFSSSSVQKQPGTSAEAAEKPVQAVLRMAGGEFCGNAAMSTAALYAFRNQKEDCLTETVRICVSGAADPVTVCLSRNEGDPRVFSAGICMPKALMISERMFSFGEITGLLPVVKMQGISHIIIEKESPFFSLKKERSSAEQAVKEWCAELNAEGLGLMFLDLKSSLNEEKISGCMDPLVYIPAADTVFWENSCASGSSAAGMYLADQAGQPVEVSLQEPGGILRVSGTPDCGETWLYGSTSLIFDSSENER